jgi:hypothetical protein
MPMNAIYQGEIEDQAIGGGIQFPVRGQPMEAIV